MSRFKLTIGPHHLPIPYPPVEHEDSTNYGFVDLKSHPESVDQIVEAIDCPPLQDCLRRINAPDVHFATLACEKLFQDCRNDEHPHLRRMVRGYVDLCFAQMDLNSRKNNFENLVGLFLQWVRCHKQPYCSSAEFSLTRATYGFNGNRLQGFALTVSIIGSGATDDEAMQNYGTLLTLLTDFLTSQTLHV